MRHCVVTGKVLSSRFFYIIPLPKKPLFLRICSISLLKTRWEKEKIARYEQFLLFPQCFQHFQRISRHFHQIQNCCLQTLSVWKSLKFFVRERVKGPFESISYWLNCMVQPTRRCVNLKFTKSLRGNKMFLKMFRNAEPYCSISFSFSVFKRPLP